MTSRRLWSVVLAFATVPAMAAFSGRPLSFSPTVNALPSKGESRQQTVASFAVKGFSYGPNGEEINLEDEGRDGCSRTYEITVEVNFRHWRTWFLDWESGCTIWDNPAYYDKYEGGDVQMYVSHGSSYIAETVAANGIEVVDAVTASTDTVELVATPRYGYTFLYWRAYTSDAMSSYSTQYNTASLNIPASALDGLYLYAEFKKNSF